MKKILYLLLFVLQICLISCGESPKQLFETAELEMLQANYPHATQLYLEIVAAYPESDFAAKAQKRLEEIKVK